jgi:hypothetical protein
VSPEAARRLAKAERFLAQATQLVPVDAPEATVHLTYYAMSLSRAFNRAEDARLLSDYADDAIPDVIEASQMRQTAKAFIAFCRFMLEADIGDLS